MKDQAEGNTPGAGVLSELQDPEERFAELTELLRNTAKFKDAAIAAVISHGNGAGAGIPANPDFDEGEINRTAHLLRTLLTDSEEPGGRIELKRGKTRTYAISLREDRAGLAREAIERLGGKFNPGNHAASPDNDGRARYRSQRKQSDFQELVAAIDAFFAARQAVLELAGSFTPEETGADRRVNREVAEET